MSQKFLTVENALRFAFDDSRHSCTPSILGKLVKGEPTPPKIQQPDEIGGINGFDGAANAAYIQRAVMSLPAKMQMALYASYAPRRTRCECRSSCCSGFKPNQAWLGAVRELEELAMREALAGCKIHRTLRASLMRVLLGDPAAPNLTEIAEQCEVSPNTVTAHKSRMRAWLDGKKVDKFTSGVRPQALERISEVLKDAGFTVN